MANQRVPAHRMTHANRLSAPARALRRFLILLAALLLGVTACGKNAPSPVSAQFSPTAVATAPTRPRVGAVTPTPIPPSPTVVPTASPTVAPTASLTVVPTSASATWVVGNTGGDGVYIRRTPNLADKIKAWPDGTPMIEAGTDPSGPAGDPAAWKYVRDPAGTVGWIPAAYLIRAPAVSASSTAPVSVAPAGSTASLSPSCMESFGDFCLVTTNVESGQYVWYVTGSVLNKGARTYGYVQVDISLHDNSGARIGSTISNVNNVGPGETWTFRARVFETRPGVTYRIDRISGF